MARMDELAEVAPGVWTDGEGKIDIIYTVEALS